MNEQEFPGFNDEGVEFITVAPQFTFNHQIQKEAVSEFRQKGNKNKLSQGLLSANCFASLDGESILFFHLPVAQVVFKIFLGFFKAGIEL